MGAILRPFPYLMNPRETILSLFNGQKPPSPPVFSGLIHVTAEGVQSEGFAFHEVHGDAGKMAKAAASTHRLGGFPSAVAPLDLYVEAEALGAGIDFRKGDEFSFPQVRKAGFNSAKSLSGFLQKEVDVPDRGRIKLVCDAIKLLNDGVGNEAVIGGMIPGPYTLLLLVVDAKNMFVEMKKEPQAVTDALGHLASFLTKVGGAYRNAGADFITIHDMGGSPAFIGPAKYEQFVLPAQQLLIEKLPKPRVLSVCGNVTSSLHLLSQTGADAISIDQTVDPRAARAALKDTLLFGNLDPVETFFNGDHARVRGAVLRAKEAGVDAVWPGCDLVIETPMDNLRTLA
jgi:[methyl-Co(III) methanol-specific corrinoid protein]:coenzyme M methyltransferase